MKDTTIKVHNVKCHSKAFEVKWDGRKPWEYRLNDRNYKEGELINEMEFRVRSNLFTGREILERIEFILYGGEYGILEGYVIMTTKEISRKK